MAVVKELWCYPVKACQGCRLREARLTDSGLELDRAWCVVDLDGTRYRAREQLSQRKLAKLATIQTRIEGDQLLLSAGGAELAVPLAEAAYAEAERITVECGAKSTTSSGEWQLGTLDGRLAPAPVNNWLSGHLNAVDSQDKPPARYALVRSVGVRMMSRYAGPTQAPYVAEIGPQQTGEGSPFKMFSVPVSECDSVRFSDFSACHLANRASLAEVDKASGFKQYPIASFRPNIVVEAEPWGEEDWLEFQVGETLFRKLKNTPRCTVPARCQQTGDWVNPARTHLVQATIKKMFPHKCLDPEWGPEWEGPMFGIHCAAKAGGVVREGDQVMVKRSRASWQSRVSEVLNSRVLLACVVLCISLCYVFHQ